MRLLISFAALFLSALLIQLGSGSLAPLDTLSASEFGWTTGQIGLLGSAHFAGFFIGCWVMPRMIGMAGHSRAFATAAAIGAVGVILHPVLQGAEYWAALRVLSGISIAGCYTVIEAWMQAKIQPGIRGRVYGIYRTVDLVGSMAAQAMIALLTPASYVSYNIVAMFCVLCLVPLAVTRQVPPVVDHPPTLQPLRAWRVSPLACFTIVIAGATGASFRMIGPLFGTEFGLSHSQIAGFLIAAVMGAALAQIPVGWMADKLDRRWVMNGLSATALGVSVWVTSSLEYGDAGGAYIAAALFGASAITIYSVAAAHANDFCSDDFRVELNAALIFFFSVGAITAPSISAAMIGQFGATGLFWFIGTSHLVLIVFTLYRMTRRGTRTATPYRYLPRTSMLQQRFWKSRRDQAGESEKENT